MGRGGNDTQDQKECFPPSCPSPDPGNDTLQGFTRTVASWRSGPWTEAGEGVPSHGALVRCDHQRQVRCVLPEHSFSGDYGKDLPLKLLLRLHSPSLQVKSPSNQLPKLDSVQTHPHPCMPTQLNSGPS